MAGKVFERLTFALRASNVFGIAPRFFWRSRTTVTQKRHFHSIEQYSHPKIVRLPDGRDLSYDICGSPSGHPIFYFHGLPGSRVEGTLWDRPAEELGAQVIAVDRPGTGHSSPHPTRTLLTYAQDIRHLAKQLDMPKYSIIGTSGGGPSALACAYAHPPEALSGVALVAGVGSYDMVSRNMMLANRIFFWLFRYPWLMRPLGRMSVAGLSNPMLSDDEVLDVIEKRINSRFSMQSRLPEKDRQVMKDRETMQVFLASVRQQFLQGTDGWAQEGKLLTEDLGFRLQDIKVLMRLWYGKQDINVPSSMGVELSDRIGQNAELMIEDQGHVSLLMNCREKILKDLLSVV